MFIVRLCKRALERDVRITCPWAMLSNAHSTFSFGKVLIQEDKDGAQESAFQQTPSQGMVGRPHLERYQPKLLGTTVPQGDTWSQQFLLPL